ncbi:MAG: winged helix-turn-helix transcriptional regulator [Theionarchaea archaeon]|nr:winged helix-turn-helix transcriptional regulator [Theionarchaea archaeon]
MQIKDEILKIFGRKGTMQIMEFLNRHNKVQYNQMRQFTNTHTLNRRIRELLKYQLVEHYLDKTKPRREWYEITEKGRKVLQCAQELLESVKTLGIQKKQNKIDEITRMELLALLGSKDTKEILQYLRKHEKVQYTNFDLSISVPTLNKRLRKLLKFNLIEHCITKEPRRREWYEITEKGKNVLKIMEDMIRVVEN